MRQFAPNVTGLLFDIEDAKKLALVESKLHNNRQPLTDDQRCDLAYVLSLLISSATRIAD